MATGKNSYRNLLVWQRGIDLVVDVYRLTKDLPQEERYGLRSQARRAAHSVPSNIAEGHGRWHPKEFLQSLSIARGSLQELGTHFEVMIRLAYVEKSEVDPVAGVAEEVMKMLVGLIKAVRKRSS